MTKTKTPVLKSVWNIAKGVFGLLLVVVGEQFAEKYNKKQTNK